MSNSPKTISEKVQQEKQLTSSIDELLKEIKNNDIEHEELCAELFFLILSSKDFAQNIHK